MAGGRVEVDLDEAERLAGEAEARLAGELALALAAAADAEAAPVGSDYLLAQVAPPARARAAVDRIAAALPADLRPAFLERGQLAVALAH